MKAKIVYLTIILIFFGVLYSFLFQSCKNESTVQPPNNTNQNPVLPVLVSPQNETTTRYLQPTMVWQSYQSAVSYELQISLDANMAGTMIFDSSGITGTQIQLPAGRLHTFVYYYWRVKAALSGNNTSEWSGIWRFNIILNAPLAPVLIAPPNGATGQSFTPTLQWNSVDSADFYRVQLSQSSSFSNILFDSNHIQLSQLQVPVFYLNTGTQYFWRANAANSNGVSTSQWSSVFNFTTINGPTPNSISGRITFVDSNFIPLPLYYSFSVFTAWPPTLGYTKEDSLQIHKIGDVYVADYSVNRLYNGNYYLAVTVSGIGTIIPYVEGIYGCDTVHPQFSNCPNSPSTVQIVNNNGLININFLSWADTGKRIF